MKQLVLICGLIAALVSAGQSQDFLQLFLPPNARPFDAVGELPHRFSAPSHTIEAPVDPSVSSLSLRWDSYEIYKEHRSDRVVSEWAGTSHTLDLWMAARVNGFQPYTRLTVHRSNFSTAFNPLADERAEFEKGGLTADLHFTLPVTSEITLSTAAGQFADRLHSHGNLFGSIQLHVRENLLLGIASTHRGSPQVLYLTIEDIHGLLPLDFRNTGVRTWIDWRLFPRLSTHVEFENLSISPLTGVVREQSTRFSPHGESVRITWSSLWQLSQTWHSYGHYQRTRVNLEGMFLAKDLSYGRISNADARDELIRFGLGRLRDNATAFLLQLEWRRVDASAAGVLDGLPFIDKAQWLALTRAYFNANGSLEVVNFHTGLRTQPLSPVTIGVGAYLFRAFPQLQLTTWEPKALGFGRKNIETRSLAFERVDGLVVSANLEVGISHFTVRSRIIQVIPLHIRKSPPGTNEILISSPSGPLQSSGGRIVQVEIFRQI